MRRAPKSYPVGKRASRSRGVAASAPHALAGILDAVLVGGECSAEEGMDYESKAFALCCTTADMREGTRAFLERRKPEFTGK